MKKIACIVLSVAMALSTGACGQSSGPSAPAASSSAAGSTAASTQGNAYTPPDNMTMFAAYDVGGGVDIFGRKIANLLESNGLYDSKFLYENIGGASGQVGLAAIANQHDGDDSYLISCSSTFLNSAYQSGKENAYGYKNLTMVAQVCSDYRCLVVPASSPFQTLEELVAYGKTNEIVGAISGTGGIGQIGLEMLVSESGIKLRNVPFAGSSDVIAAILGSQVDVCIQAIQSALEYSKAGQMRVLAVCAPERVSEFPDVPTMAECGYDIVLPTSRGIAMPANVSEQAREYWIGRLKALSETADFQQYCAENCYVLEFLGGDDYLSAVEADCEATTEVMKQIGLYGKN